MPSVTLHGLRGAGAGREHEQAAAKSRTTMDVRIITVLPDKIPKDAFIFSF
jgi:hypothetical protein